MVRISHHMEEPHKSRIQHALFAVLKFRNIEWPSPAKPMNIMYLADDSFQPDLTEVLELAIKKAAEECTYSTALHTQRKLRPNA